ncbi:isoleucine--tRNA ligase, partial [bacterium]
TRGWFYTLLAISTFVKKQTSYKTCVVMELVLDKNGQKMSKSRGNVVDPVAVIEKFGADPLRWYFMTTSPPWIPTRFDEDGVSEVFRKFFDTFRNTYNFFAIYATIDGYEPQELPEELPNILDRWLISRLNTLIKQYREWMDDYQMTRSARAIQSFVIDELSNWYVRRNRRRFWRSGMDKDKITAYTVLWTALKTVCELIAPFAPMTADFYWRALTESIRDSAGESVHFVQIGQHDDEKIDAELEDNISLLIKIVELGRSARSNAQINIRQPLAKMFIVLDEGMKELPDDMTAVAREELNVKEIEYFDDASMFTSYRIKPNFRELGKKFGSRMPQVKAAIESMDTDEIISGMNDGRWHISIDGTDHTLTEEDIEVEMVSKENFSVASDRGITVALDVKISSELRAEGYAREAVNRIQNTRKEAGLEVTDRINLALITDDAELKAALEKHREDIANETLAMNISFEQAEKPDFQKDWKIAGRKITIAVRKVV